MLWLRVVAPVVARHRGKRRHLAGREAPQLSVPDQVGAVLVVVVACDVLADVVEQGGVLEQLAVVLTQMVKGEETIEEVAGQTGHLSAVALVPVAAPAQLEHGGPAHRLGVGRPIAHVVTRQGLEHHALPQRRLGGDDLIEAEEVHRGREHHRPHG